MAEELLDYPHLPSEIACTLQDARGEFLFGSTAPDVQMISGQSRQATHFLRLPIQAGDQRAWELILADYPRLAAPELLQVPQVAFLAGYLCHLQADWIWNQDIFAPIFGPRCSWGTFHERLYYHNILRAYLDQRILPGLGEGIAAYLRQVEPDGWLPFVEDHHLAAWRDFLSEQLRPGAVTQTVEVFSSRQGISVPEYYALLESEERMQHEVFAHIPLERVEIYRNVVIEENVHLLTAYLVLSLHQQHELINKCVPKGTQL